MTYSDGMDARNAGDFPETQKSLMLNRGTVRFLAGLAVDPEGNEVRHAVIWPERYPGEDTLITAMCGVWAPLIRVNGRIAPFTIHGQAARFCEECVASWLCIKMPPAYIPATAWRPPHAFRLGSGMLRTVAEATAALTAEGLGDAPEAPRAASEGLGDGLGTPPEGIPSQRPPRF